MRSVKKWVMGRFTRMTTVVKNKSENVHHLPGLNSYYISQTLLCLLRQSMTNELAALFQHGQSKADTMGILSWRTKKILCNNLADVWRCGAITLCLYESAQYEWICRGLNTAINWSMYRFNAWWLEHKVRNAHQHPRYQRYVFRWLSVSLIERISSNILSIDVIAAKCTFTHYKYDDSFRSPHRRCLDGVGKNNLQIVAFNHGKYQFIPILQSIFHET